MPDQPAGDNPVPNTQPTDQPQTPTPTEPTPTFMDTGSMAPPPPAPNTPPGTTEEVPPPAGEAPGGPPVVTTAAPPKKKKVKARVIATILGILFLVGGVTAGVLLVQQQQELREEAAEPEWDVPITSSYKVCRDGKCVAEGKCPQGAKCADVCQSDGDCGPTGVLPFKTPTPGGTGDCASQNIKCYSYECPQGCVIRKDCCCTGAEAGTHLCGKNGEGGGNCVCKAAECRSNRKEVSCSSQPSPCGQIDKIGLNGTYCGQVGTQCTNGTNPCDGGGGGQTPPPTATASCADVKAYNTSWVAMSAADLNNLNIGDKVNFCVRGSTSSGSFDKGRFRVNLDDAINLNWQETTTRRPGATNEFCLNYTLDTVGNFVVDGQIHHSALNKWY